MTVRKNGFTLAELIIFLALLGIVLSIGYNLFFYGQRTFSSGSEKYQVQSDIRLVSDFISAEVRNATEMDIITIPFTEQAGYNYIYLQDSKIKHRYNGTITEKSQGIMNDQIIFNLIKDSNDKNFLKISLKATVNTEVYTVNTDIFLNNISGKTAVSGKAIRYKKP